jgi:hypothetical protein
MWEEGGKEITVREGYKNGIMGKETALTLRRARKEGDRNDNRMRIRWKINTEERRGDKDTY